MSTSPSSNRTAARWRPEAAAGVRAPVRGRRHVADPAARTTAGRCAEGGLSVAIVESELVGGDCSYWGCIPSKVLLRPGDVLAAAPRVAGAASTATGGTDAAATFARRDRFAGDWDDSDALPWLTDRGAEREVARVTRRGCHVSIADVLVEGPDSLLAAGTVLGRGRSDRSLAAITRLLRS